MRILIGCIVLLLTPTIGLVAVKQYQARFQGAPQLPGTGSLAHGEVLFFNAAWCGPCRQMKPIVKQLRSQGFRMRDVDIDKNHSLAEKFGIRSVPTFVFVENGSEVSRFSGGTSPANLRRLCATYR
jgi:thioredoxin 1